MQYLQKIIKSAFYTTNKKIKNINISNALIKKKLNVLFCIKKYDL